MILHAERVLRLIEDLMQSTTLGVVELRRYVMRPGRRDDLMALFDRHFIESQEECGMLPIGQYRDLDDPDLFVWFRGFRDMASRAPALDCFYGRSPAWLDHRDAANDTMIDSDNVLLLRPARAGSGFGLPATRPSAAENGAARESYVAASVLMLQSAADEAFIEAFETTALERVRGFARNVSYFVTDPSPNEFPRLPVREGEFAFVATGVCRDLQALTRWNEAFQEFRVGGFAVKILSVEFLRLEAAGRSLYG